MEKGMAADVPTAEPPISLATVPPPPTGEPSIADKPAGGRPSGSITVPPDVREYPRGTLAKDESGAWTFTEGGQTRKWDPVKGGWWSADGTRWGDPPPAELGAALAEHPNLPREDSGA